MSAYKNNEPAPLRLADSSGTADQQAVSGLKDSTELKHCRDSPSYPPTWTNKYKIQSN